MKIAEIKQGEYFSRDNWGTSKQLAITLDKHFCLLYISGGLENNTKKVRANSSAYIYDDFYLSDKYGNKLLTQKEQQMKQEDIKFIVTNNKSNTVKCFQSEDDRDDYIEEQMDLHSRIKFVIFEPTYKVEPKRPSLKNLFKKIIK